MKSFTAGDFVRFDNGIDLQFNGHITGEYAFGNNTVFWRITPILSSVQGISSVMKPIYPDEQEKWYFTPSRIKETRWDERFITLIDQDLTE